MSFFGNTNNSQANLVSNNSTQALSNSSSQVDKEKQGQATSLFGNTNNPQINSSPSFFANNPQTNSSLFGGSANNSTYNANQTNINNSFLNTSNQSNNENKEKTEQANKPFGSGSLFGGNTSSGSNLFGKSENTDSLKVSGSLFSKPADDSNKISTQNTATTSLFGGVAKTENTAATANNTFGAGYKAAASQANEEKKTESNSLFGNVPSQTNKENKENKEVSSTPLFGGTSNKSNTSLFGDSTLPQGNLFGNSNSSNTTENKPATNLFSFGTGVNASANRSVLFGQNKSANENSQDAKDNKITSEVEKEQPKSEALNPLKESSLLGNENKASEPEKSSFKLSNNTNLFNNASNAPTTTASDAHKNSLFGAPSKPVNQQETKTNIFGGSGISSNSSNLFGGNKTSENVNDKTNTENKSEASANIFTNQANKIPQFGSNQGLFSSTVNKNEEKSEVQKDSQQPKTLFGSSSTSNNATNPFTASNLNKQSTPKKVEECKQAINLQDSKQNQPKPFQSTLTSNANLFENKEPKAENKASFGVSGTTNISTQPKFDANKSNANLAAFGEKKEANVINLNKADQPSVQASKASIPATTGLSSDSDKKVPSEISKNLIYLSIKIIR